MLTNAVMNNPFLAQHMLGHKVASPSLMELTSTSIEHLRTGGITNSGSSDSNITINDVTMQPGSLWVHHGKGNLYFKTTLVSKGALLDINSESGKTQTFDNVVVEDGGAIHLTSSGGKIHIHDLYDHGQSLQKFETAPGLITIDHYKTDPKTNEAAIKIAKLEEELAITKKELEIEKEEAKLNQAALTGKRPQIQVLEDRLAQIKLQVQIAEQEGRLGQLLLI